MFKNAQGIQLFLKLQSNSLQYTYMYHKHTAQ